MNLDPRLIDFVENILSRINSKRILVILGFFAYILYLIKSLTGQQGMQPEVLGHIFFYAVVSGGLICLVGLVSFSFASGGDSINGNGNGNGNGKEKEPAPAPAALPDSALVMVPPAVAGQPQPVPAPKP